MHVENWVFDPFTRVSLVIVGITPENLDSILLRRESINWNSNQPS